MIPRTLAAVLGVSVAALAFAPAFGRAASQEAINVVSQSTQNEFPRGVTFSISFDAPAPAAEVRLQYELAPDGTGATGVADCTDAAVTTCTYTLLSGRGIFVIPGAEITYSWRIADEDGNELTTGDQLYVHEDTRFDFQTIGEGNVTVYYHSGTESQAADVLAASVEALESVGSLLQTQVTFPVKVFLYRTAQEMQPAIVPTGGRGVQVLGEVVYSDTAMVSADVSTLDIVRHEIAHIVTREATRGPFGIAGWLNEGISVFAQRNPLPGNGAALDAAIRNDRVLTMPELQSSATGGISSTVNLYYAQSGDIVRFLVETYGEDRFAELIGTFRDGATADDAFMQVYGFDALGLENAWRSSVGLTPRVPATPDAEATREAQARATEVAGADIDDGASATSDDSGDVNWLAPGLAALLVVAAIAAGAWTFSVARSRIP